MADVEENENPGPETSTEVVGENQQLETGQETTENGSTDNGNTSDNAEDEGTRILLSQTQSLTIISRRGETRRLTRFNKKYRTSKGERDYEKVLRDSEAEEKRRTLRLARIRDRELELQVLKGLPANKVEEWITNQRKNASKKIQRFYREKVTADGNAQRTGGVAYGVVRDACRRLDLLQTSVCA